MENPSVSVYSNFLMHTFSPLVTTSCSFKLIILRFITVFWLESAPMTYKRTSLLLHTRQSRFAGMTEGSWIFSQLWEEAGCLFLDLDKVRLNRSCAVVPCGQWGRCYFCGRNNLTERRRNDSVQAQRIDQVGVEAAKHGHSKKTTAIHFLMPA